MGEGEVEVNAYTSKDKEIILGLFTSSDTIKIPGNLAYVNFTLTPNTVLDPPYHVSAVKQDNNNIPYGDENLVDQGDGIYTYKLDVELKMHAIDVTFSQEETAIVPGNTEATVFLGLTVSLTVNNDRPEPLTFFGTELDDPESILAWEITTEVIDGLVRVSLRFTDEEDPRDRVFLYRTDLEYPNADVTGDNQITSDDVNDVASVNPGTGPDDPDWNSTLDINGDLVIDNLDVTIVSGYNPLNDPPGVWEDITEDWEQIGPTEWLVFGYTDHFSVFRCR